MKNERAAEGKERWSSVNHNWGQNETTGAAGERLEDEMRWPIRCSKCL